MDALIKGLLQGSIPTIVLVGGTHYLVKGFKVSRPVVYWGSLAVATGLTYAVVQGKIKAPFMNAETFGAELEDCYVCDGMFKQVYVCDNDCGFQCCEIDIDGNLIPVENADGTVKDYCITCYEEKYGAETFNAEYEDCQVCFTTVEKGGLNDVQAGLICDTCYDMNKYAGGTGKENNRPYSAETFGAETLRVWAKDMEKDHLGYFVSKNKDGWETWRGLCGMTSDKGVSRFNVSDYDGSYGRRCRKCLTAYKKMGKDGYNM